MCRLFDLLGADNPSKDGKQREIIKEKTLKSFVYKRGWIDEAISWIVSVLRRSE